MKLSNLTVATASLFALACAGSPPPTQQLADVPSANRSATELGAQRNPKAQLHLKLSEEQLKLAKTAIEDDDNETAGSLLMRAKADAELAIALTRQDDAKMEETRAIDQSNAQRSTNAKQGVPQ